MANYKVCNGGVIENSVVTLTAIGSPRTEITNGTSCDSTKVFQNYRFQSTVPCDVGMWLRYTWQWRVSYEYPASAGWSLWQINTGSVYLPAGQLVVNKEMKVSENWCCFGDAEPSQTYEPQY